MQSLKDAMIYKFGDSQVRLQLDSVVELLQSMVRGTSPDVDHMTEVLEPGTLPKKISGHHAFVAKLAHIQKVEKEGSLTFDMMQELHTFQFLASPTEATELSRITNALLSQ
eukprot:8795771-Lingulodinium_polyedra.AAC.1